MNGGDGLRSWLEDEIRSCERRLTFLRSIYVSLFSGDGSWKPNEKIEEVRHSNNKRNVLGNIYYTDTYVRLVPKFELPDVDEITGYISFIVDEIREMQKNLPIRASLYISRNDGSIKEIKVSNLDNFMEILKVKAAYKHILELGYEILKANMRVVRNG